MEDAEITLSYKIEDIFTFYKSGFRKISREIFGQEGFSLCWIFPVSFLKKEDFYLEK